MKSLLNFLALSITLLCSAPCFSQAAQDKVVVGMLVYMPVSTGPDTKNFIRKDYLFLNKKLTEPTRFFGFETIEKGKAYLICCIKVENMKPVSLEDVANKLNVKDGDEEAVVRSISNLPYIYEASPSEESDMNHAMQSSTVRQEDIDANVGVEQVTYAYISVDTFPVISGNLRDINEISEHDYVPNKFSMNGHRVEISARGVTRKNKNGVPIDWGEYKFVVDGTVVKFSAIHPPCYVCD